MEQRTDEWFSARLGKITASNVWKIFSKGQVRKTYMLDLLAERIEGQQEQVKSKAMDRGAELEPEAKEAYSFKTGEFIEDVGFIDHPIITGLGASPDGLIGACGLIEIKCPYIKQHLNTIISGHVEPMYIHQMYTQMSCTGRWWCDFVSYYPNLGDNSLFIKRFKRDEHLIAEIDLHAMFFLIELNELENKLKNR